MICNHAVLFILILADWSVIWCDLLLLLAQPCDLKWDAVLLSGVLYVTIDFLWIYLSFFLWLFLSQGIYAHRTAAHRVTDQKVGVHKATNLCNRSSGAVSMAGAKNVQSIQWGISSRCCPHRRRCFFHREAPRVRQWALWAQLLKKLRCVKERISLCCNELLFYWLLNHRPVIFRQYFPGCYF